MKQQKEEIDPESMTRAASVEVAVDCAQWFSIEGELGADLTSYINDICNKTLIFIGFTSLVQQADISFLLSDDDELQRLNNEFRHQDKPTNVLSFPAQVVSPGAFTDFIVDELPLFIGDVAVSYQRIFEESISQGIAFKDHFTHIVVHSVLHLLGYDHVKDNDATQMEALETSILAKMGFKNPYSIGHITDAACIKY